MANKEQEIDKLLVVPDPDFEPPERQSRPASMITRAMLGVYANTIEDYAGAASRNLVVFLRRKLSTLSDETPFCLTESYEDRQLGYVEDICQNAIMKNQRFSDIFYAHAMPSVASQDDESIGDDEDQTAVLPIAKPDIDVKEFRGHADEPMQLQEINGSHFYQALYEDQKRGGGAMAKLTFDEFLLLCEWVKESGLLDD